MKSQNRSKPLWLMIMIPMLFLMGMVGGVALDRQTLVSSIPIGIGPDSKQLDLPLIEQAWHIIQQNYVDQSAIQPTKLSYGAIAGMVDALGDTDHSVFLTPAMVAQEHDSLQGQFAGIGAEVRSKNKQVVIVAPMDGSPAQKAGLRPGDIIVKVNGSPVAGLPLQQVVDKILGPAGTQVSLTVLNPKDDKTRTLTLRRARIKVRSVSWHMIPGTSIADVRIAIFSKGTAGELQQALAEIEQHGAKGLVLDLRNDPGGFFSQALAVASQFLRTGNVVLEKNVRGKITAVPVEQTDQKIDLPMTVLVNVGTASAAEIVSGALQDANRAKLIGETTFGTGTVLKEFPLPGGSALMLAVDEWLTPDGNSIWHVGIKPNITVALPADGSPLIPAEIRGMTEAQFAASTDAQLKHALDVLQKEISSVPKPALQVPNPESDSGKLQM